MRAIILGCCCCLFLVPGIAQAQDLCVTPTRPVPKLCVESPGNYSYTRVRVEWSADYCGTPPPDTNKECERLGPKINWPAGNTSMPGLDPPYTQPGTYTIESPRVDAVFTFRPRPGYTGICPEKVIQEATGTAQVVVIDCHCGAQNGYNPAERGCCNGQTTFDLNSQCCVNGQVVAQCKNHTCCAPGQSCGDCGCYDGWTEACCEGQKITLATQCCLFNGQGSGTLCGTSGTCCKNCQNGQFCCEVGQTACGADCIDPGAQGCCNGMPFTFGVQKCCGKTLIPAAQGCCGNKGFDETTQCCHGGVIYPKIATGVPGTLDCCSTPVNDYHDVQSCPGTIKQPDSYVATFNGCGTDEFPGNLVPQNPCGLATTVFTECCNDHDRGYGQCSLVPGKPDKEQVDRAFYDCILAICNNTTPPDANCPSLAPAIQPCSSIAAAYLVGVATSDIGLDSWHAGQVAACVCCVNGS